MKKLVLFLFMFILISYVSADDVGYCCIPDVAIPDEPAVMPVDSEAQCVFPNAWISYPEDYQDTDEDYQTFTEFLITECPVVLDQEDSGEDDANPPQEPQISFWDLSGTVFDENNDPLGNVEIYLNLRGANAIFTTESDGVFNFEDLQEQEYLYLYLRSDECVDDYFVVNLTQDLTDQNFNLQCSDLICEEEEVDIDDVVPITNSFEIEIYPDQTDLGRIDGDCQVNDLVIKICVDNDNDCVFVMPEGNVFDDEFLLLNLLHDNLGYTEGGWLDFMFKEHEITEINLALGLQFPSAWVFGDFYELDLGNSSCWLNDGEFCHENQIVECDHLNLVDDPIEICSNNEYCYQDNNRAECREQEACGYCSGITGMFPGIFSTVSNGNEISCSSLIENNAYSSCFEASSFTPQNYFEECSNFDSCYDYTTESACDLSPCGSPNQNSCDWLSSQLNISGRGLCVPSGEAVNCFECTELYGEDCGKEMCESFSGCVYGFRAGEANCLPIERFACMDYETEEDCNGGVDVDVDVNYSYGERVSGTNILSPSNDTHGIGICYWGVDDYGNPSCVRDADANEEADPCVGGFLDYVCQADNSPPETYFPLVDGTSISESDLKNVDFVVYDEGIGVPFENTFFCVNLEGQDACYPDEQLENLNIESEGFYLLRYYSEDSASNLEPVKEISLVIMNTSDLVIDDISIGELP